MIEDFMSEDLGQCLLRLPTADEPECRKKTSFAREHSHWLIHFALYI